MGLHDWGPVKAQGLREAPTHNTQFVLNTHGGPTHKTLIFVDANVFCLGLVVFFLRPISVWTNRALPARSGVFFRPEPYSAKPMLFLLRPGLLLFLEPMAFV